ncbi:hypothetical protein BG000_008471, partial [Podila horticola]
LITKAGKILGSKYVWSAVSMFTIFIMLLSSIENPTQQRLVVWVAMGFFGFFFSVLIKLFQVKNPGYPFTLLFK